MKGQAIEISWVSLWRILAVAVFVLALYLMREAVQILLLALVISTALHPPVDWLERRRIPRVLGTILIFLVTLSVLSFLIYTILPVVILELNSLLKDLTGLANQFFGIRAPINIVNFLTPNLNELTNILISGRVPFLDILGRLLGGAAFVLATLVLSFYLTASRSGIERFILAVFPADIEEQAINLYSRTSRKIGRWFQAQIVLSLIIGIVVFLGLWLLASITGEELTAGQSLVLGVIAAIFELVPIAGPIFAGGLAVLVAAGISLKLALYVLLFFVIVQQLEGNLIVPAVMKQAIGVHPVIILVALLGGAQIGGLIGILLAVPVVVFLQELVEDWVAVKKRRTREKLV